MIKVRLTDVGEGIKTAEIVKWYVKKGGIIAKDQPLVDIETDKAIVTIPSSVRGVIRAIAVKVGSTVKVGDVLVDIEVKGKQKSVSVVGDIGKEKVKEGDIIIPLHKKSVESNSIGSTKKITMLDPHGHVKRMKLSGTRKTIAQTMMESYSTIPHVTHTDMVDVTFLSKQREEYKKKYKNITVTYLPFIIVAVTKALKLHPRLNASFNVDEIIFRKYYNIGIAVATDRGLLVPVIRQADTKNVLILAKEISILAQKARDNTISRQELEAGSFTITNIGSIGGIHFTPLIYPGQSAILGMGRIQKIRDKDFLPLSLSYDHRVLDGADAALFLNEITMQLQNIS